MEESWKEKKRLCSQPPIGYYNWWKQLISEWKGYEIVIVAPDRSIFFNYTHFAVVFLCKPSESTGSVRHGGSGGKGKWMYMAIRCLIYYATCKSSEEKTIALLGTFQMWHLILAFLHNPWFKGSVYLCEFQVTRAAGKPKYLGNVPYWGGRMYFCPSFPN